MKTRNVFTTSDVANICQVSTRVVTKWFDNGMLDGFRLPGSNHRRFTYDNVHNFMEKEGMPIDWLDEVIAEQEVAKADKAAKKATKKPVMESMQEAMAS